MASASNLFPMYSHGGQSFPGWVAVPGTTISNGLPIWIVGATQKPAFQCICTGAPGATMTFFIEGNGGALDANGNPPSADWVDYTGGSGYAVTIPGGGTPVQFSKFIPLVGLPLWRTRISAVTGVTLNSYVPGLVGINNVWFSASRPPVSSAVLTF